jgi:ABC-2 type transport system permease protein
MKIDSLNQFFRLKIAIQTMKDNKKITIIITLLFVAMAAMYASMFPAFKGVLEDLIESGGAEPFSQFFGPSAADMATYVGFLNLELYQIFWVIILGILIGFIAASIISKEIEGKTIDLLMSNPVSRKQIVFEKFVGLIPLLLIVNFATMLTVIGVTVAIGEDLNFYYLFLTHLASIPYLLALSGIGLLISVLIDEKMKASILFIATLIGMYVIESISKIVPDYEAIGYISITHYFDTYNSLKFGNINVSDIIILIAVAFFCLIISMLYFEHRDIEVT